MKTLFDLNSRDKKEEGTKMIVAHPNGGNVVLEDYVANGEKNKDCDEDKPLTLIVYGSGSSRALAGAAFISDSHEKLKKKKLSEDKRIEEMNKINIEGAVFFVKGWENAGMEFSKELAYKFIEGFPEVSFQIQNHSADVRNYLK